MAAIGQLPPAVGRTPRVRSRSASIRAPETRRIAVKLAASIAVSFSATRHSNELLAKASIAKKVRKAVRRPGLRSDIPACPYHGSADRAASADVRNATSWLGARHSSGAIFSGRTKDARLESRAQLVPQPVKLHRVVARHLAARLCADTAQLAVQEFLRIRPDAVGMRIVRAPHHIVLAQ